MKRPYATLCFFLICLFTFSQCSKKDNDTSDTPQTETTTPNDLLSAAKYQSIKIEIQYMPGFKPDSTVVVNLVTFLKGLINKPGGITVVQTQVPASGKSSLTLNDIKLIEKNNRTAYNSGTSLGVYLLCIDAAYSDPNVLGIAYGSTSMCLMGKTIHNNSGGVGQASRIKLESTVIHHEFGHILGLVDIGTPMQTAHKDPSHTSHCNNDQCLMYYAAETTDILGLLLTGNIPDLDANCKADLKGNGGK